MTEYHRLDAMRDLKRELVRVGVVGPDWDIYVWGTEDAPTITVNLEHTEGWQEIA